MASESVKISRFKILPLLTQHHGELFSATFYKRNGSKREILAQIRPPKKDPKRAAPAKLENQYVLVGDMQKYKELIHEGMPKEDAYNKSYRLIALGTIIRFKLGGIEYEVTD